MHIHEQGGIVVPESNVGVLQVPQASLLFVSARGSWLYWEYRSVTMLPKYVTEHPPLWCSLLKTSPWKSLRIRCFFFFFCDNVLKLDPPQRILNDRLAELNSVNYEKNLLCAKHRGTFNDSLGIFLTIS